MKLENVVVLIADEVPNECGDSFKLAGIRQVLVFGPQPLLCLFDLKNSIGNSTPFRMEAPNVVTDLFLNREGEALFRRYMEAGKNLYPAINGTVYKWNPREGGGRIIEEFVLMSVSLVTDNTDPRVPSLGDAYAKMLCSQERTQ
jgi:hypothetical protein